MAEHLASIFGTEKDRVNCPFFFKIGACRHGDRCSRLHNRPTVSQTLLLNNMYQNPYVNQVVGPDGYPIQPDHRKVQEHYEDFFEDIFDELDKFGEIENLNVCENIADHMVGNVYVKFREEESAAAAQQGLSGRFYSGRPIVVEMSPVTDFREATCRQYEEQTCNRGGYCNFIHLKPISRDVRKRTFGRYKKRERSRSRSRSRDRGRGRGGGDRDRDRDRRGRSRSPRREEREGSAERRARIASWNKKKEEPAGGDAAAAAAPPPPPPPAEGAPTAEEGAPPA